jgi:hypothetical protein
LSETDADQIWNKHEAESGCLPQLRNFLNNEEKPYQHKKSTNLLLNLSANAQYTGEHGKCQTMEASLNKLGDCMVICFAMDNFGSSA